MKINSESVKSLVMSAVLVIAGVFLCISPLLGYDAMSILFGVLLIAVGVLFVVSSVMAKKQILTSDGIIGTVILSFGIMFIVQSLARLVADYIPYFMICMGGVSLADIVVRATVKKEKKIPNFVIEGVLGGALTALGICLMLIDGLAKYVYLILGLALIVYAAFIVFVALTGKLPTKSTVNQTSPETVEQPVTEAKPTVVEQPVPVQSIEETKPATENKPKVGSTRKKLANDSKPVTTPKTPKNS